MAARTRSSTGPCRVLQIAETTFTADVVRTLVDDQPGVKIVSEWLPDDVVADRIDWQRPTVVVVERAARRPPGGARGVSAADHRSE